jgi:predicted MPP superfamily phosphohydrolase
MIFAGHTHGGQVCLPGVGALTTNSDLPLALARGLSVWNHQGRSSFLNVSAGIGTSIYAPVRFACPPEAVLVTLRAREFGYS